MLGNYDLAAACGQSSGFNPSTLILILIVVVAFYFLMIRPQQRRKQQAAQKQSNVPSPVPGCGRPPGCTPTVVEVDGDDVVLEVAPGVEVRYMKRAIMDVVSPGDEPEEPVTDFTDVRVRRRLESDDRDTENGPGRDTDVNHDAEWETFEKDDVAETGSTKKKTQTRQHHQGLAAPAQATSNPGRR